MIETTLGHYRILDRLGAGGMGEVYRAHDEKLGRDIAIKVLSAEALGDAAARPRLLREARSVAALNHPNVCTIHEVGEAEGQTYIAMELIEGRSLDRLIPEGGLAVDRVLDYGLQIADAVAHAHDRGIVHRDLKPANVLVTPGGRTKVLDFGLAKQIVAADVGEASTASHPTLTQVGAVVGTLPYMAPEQLRGEPADARSDVWALGVMLYEMAAGGRPFKGQTGFEVSSAILKERPAPLPAAVPPEVDGVIERCLEKEPERRFQRASELQAALRVAQTGTAARRTARGRRLGRRRSAAAGVVLLAVLAALVGLDPGGLRRRLLGRIGAPGSAIKLAVLPFANLSGDPAQEYFSDGLTEEMITQLGRLHPRRLGVIARTSAVRYKKSDKPIDQIGRELGVDYVLEGSARREGNRVRVTAELISVRDQTQLWAESYERELAGILSLQSDLARGVAGSLALKLLPAEERRLSDARAVNPEAYDAYLKGSQLWTKLTPGDLDAAQGYFELALAKDPNYAPAYAGLALVWAGRNQMGLASPRDAAPQMKAAALKAVALDDSLAEAHWALAGLRTWHDWDLPAAEPEFKRSIELNPNYAEVRAFYSHYLNFMRRPDEARSQIGRALELDPFNALYQSIYAVDLVYWRRYDEAIAQARKALRAQPDAPVARYALQDAFFCKGAFREALAEDKTSYAADREILEAFEQGYAETGYAGAMKRAAEALAVRSRHAFVVPTEVSRMYLSAGENGPALDWLEKAFEMRDPNLPYIVMPEYDGIRSDPRFRDLLRRLKLPL